MWQQPGPLLKVFAAQISGYVRDHAYALDIHYIEYPDTPAFNRFQEWLKTLRKIETRNIKLGRPIFYDQYGEFLLREAARIEQNQEYFLLADMLRAARDAPILLFKKIPPLSAVALRNLCTKITNQLVVLVGNESQLLVGVEGNSPAYKEVEFPADPREYSKYIALSPMISEGTLGYVNQSDVWMVPHYREFDYNLRKQSEREGGYANVTRSLMEAAYYNQRYIINTEGVYVKLTNAGDITGMHIKVHGSAESWAVDLLVRVETVHGALFFTLTDESLTDTMRAHAQFWPGTKLGAMAAQVYHDLVTASVASGEHRVRFERDVSPTVDDESSCVSWTVIQRSADGAMRKPRNVYSPSGVSRTPHHVSGHLRQAPMTKEQRKKLKSFERKTGLRILDFIPDGWTFVLPYISPKESGDSFATVPMFIRHRIQEVFEEGLEGRMQQDMRRAS